MSHVYLGFLAFALGGLVYATAFAERDETPRAVASDCDFNSEQVRRGCMRDAPGAVMQCTEQMRAAYNICVAERRDQP